MNEITLEEVRERAKAVLAAQIQEVEDIKKRHKYGPYGALQYSQNLDYMNAMLMHRQTISFCRLIFNDGHFFETEKSSSLFFNDREFFHEGKSYGYDQTIKIDPKAQI
jgi:hypothetical protein